MTKEERKEYDKKYSIENKEKRRLASKEWRENNKDKVSAYEQTEERKKGQLSRAKENNRKTTLKRKENKDIWNAYRRANHKERINSDPLYRLKLNIKSLISGSFKKKGTNKSKRTIEILGCTFNEYKTHIENQFEPWMNWSNYGAYKVNGIRTWQIDHIFPISLANSPERLIELNHYTNLRPLDSKENLDKSNNVI